MEFENFIFEKKGLSGLITLNRPEKLNTFTSSFKDELHSIAAIIEDDPEVRAVVLTAAGKAFCAGGDLDSAGSPKTILEVRTELGKIGRAINKIQSMDKPWIAAVNGIAAGGGASLAMACDFIICSENARFKYSFTDIGIAPDSGGMRRLSNFTGVSRAMELAMTCRTISAEDALDYGIALKVVPDEELANEAMEFATLIASKPPAAIAFVKKLVYSAAQVPTDIFCEMEALMVTVGTQTDDHKEGIKAFFEKRKPEFTGR